MKARLKNSLNRRVIVLSPENDSDQNIINDWGKDINGLFAQVRIQSGKNLIIRDFVDQNKLLMKPINISYVAEDPDVKILSNLACTPFVLNGKQFASVEAF